MDEMITYARKVEDLFREFIKLNIPDDVVKSIVSKELFKKDYVINDDDYWSGIFLYGLTEERMLNAIAHSLKCTDKIRNSDVIYDKMLRPLHKFYCKSENIGLLQQKMYEICELLLEVNYLHTEKDETNLDITKMRIAQKVVFERLFKILYPQDMNRAWTVPTLINDIFVPVEVVQWQKIKDWFTMEELKQKIKLVFY